MSRLNNVKIVGVGLLGSSLGLALSRKGINCFLTDNSKANLRLAVEYGAGVEFANQDTELVVVCVPPDAASEVIVQQLREHPNAVVTDVASVKYSILQEMLDLGATGLDRYVGSHPMAGREKGGPANSRADLFFARPWVITSRNENSAQAIDLVRELALAVGSLPIDMTTQEHDSAVALVSHLPQLVASALAAELAAGTETDLSLAGQGLRDTTRIANSDPELWIQILSRNASSLAPHLRKVSDRIVAVAEAIENIDRAGSLASIHQTLQAGNQGVERIPGKHGGKYANYATVTVIIDDSPGALAELLTFIGSIGVNLEDLKLEHSPGAEIGLAELQVLPQAVETLTTELTSNGWRLV